MIAKRRPQQPFSVSSEQAKQIKKYNNTQVRYVQGFLQPLAASSTTNVNITLFSAGRFLLGVSVLPVGTADISNTAITFLVNNNNLLNNVGVQNLNPNFVQAGMGDYFPLPQPLVGNDNIQANFIKSDAGSISVYINVFYLPRI